MVLQLAESLPFLGMFSQKISPEERLHEKKLSALKEEIEDSKVKLRFAHENFNNVCEPKLIDFYIYKIQSEQSRYEQLLLEYREEEQRYIHSVSE